MQFASFRDFRLNASGILKQTHGEENVVITKRGKPVGVLVPASEDFLETLLEAIKRARIQKSVQQLQKQAQKAQAHSLSMKEIDAEINRARSE